MNDAKCVLVVGATAGIGRALALAIHDLPSKPTVIVAGRRQERLDELCSKSERIKGVQVDVTGGKDSLKEFSTHVTTHYPELDAVIFSSGIQHLFKLEEPETIDLDLFETELVTNYTSVITMITYFLPQFLKLSEKGRPSFIVPITSVLGIVPGPWVPYYSATKAALHSLSLSLHTQLKDTQVNVMEIFPPLVESELHDHQGTRERLSRTWMPLEEFTRVSMEGLCRGDTEIPVGDAVGKWETFEKGKLDAMANVPTHRFSEFGETKHSC